MDFLLRLLPLFIGSAAGFLVISSFASSSKSTKFIAVTLCIWLMGYFFTWYNIKLLRRAGCALLPRRTNEKLLGHLLIAIGAVAAGYSFAAGDKVILVIGMLGAMGCLWAADDKLTPLVWKPYSQVPEMRSIEPSIGTEKKGPILRPRSLDPGVKNEPPPAA